jgi:WD40 repeat protein
VQSAEQYIQAAKRHGSRTSHAAYDIFLSVDRRDWDYGAPLVEALRRHGASVFTAAEASDPTAPSAEQRKEALDISQSFVFVAGAGPDLEAENDLNQFLRDSLNDQTSRPALPVILKTSIRSALPQSLRGHRVLSGREDPLILAARIVGALSLNRGLRLERQFTGHTDVILRLAWHPQGKQLSTSSVDNSAKIWDVPTGELIVTLRGHSFGVNRAIWSPDAKLLATCSFDRTLRIWCTEDWNCLRIIDKPHEDDIPSLAWSPDSRLLASGTADGMIFVWDSSTWELLLRVNTQSQSINCILWFKDSSRIYAACADGSIGVWAINNGKCEVQLRGHGGDVVDIAVSHQRCLLASWSFDRSIKIWMTDPLREIETLRLHTDAVRSVSFSTDGQWLASNSLDGWVCIWDCSTWQPKIFVPETLSEYWPCSLAFSPTDQELATLGDEDTISRVWRLESDRQN